jgi:thiol-disulfide isomerase/thioredoxin
MRVILISLLALVLFSCGKEETPVRLESIMEGNILEKKDWQGKWVYINYWAEWCKPCAEEIPELNKFAAANSDVLVLGVNFDKPSSLEAINQANRMHIEFSVVPNDAVLLAFPHEIPQNLPVTIVINPEGKIVQTLQGPQTQATLAEAKKS